MAMDLGSVISRVSGKLSGGNHNHEAFLAVKISSESILAAAWSIVDGKVTIGQIGTGAIASQDWEGMLKGLDQAVSTALPGESTTPAKTIFAVPFDWVVEGKIEPSHLTDLRRLCKELDLSPQGFVVTSEALENYYKETEGAPLTAILIGVDGNNGFLTTYRAGVNLGTTLFDWSDGDIAQAVEKVLKTMTRVEVLPSRIIVYDGKGNLEQIADKLTAHPWTKQLPFLHFPKVEIVPAESVVKAVAVAGGVQMGGTFEVSPEPVPAPVSTQPQPETEPQLELEEVSMEDAGFSNEDILIDNPVKNAEIPKTAINESIVAASQFGQIRDLSSEAAAPLTVSNKPTEKINLSEIKEQIGRFLTKITNKFRGLFTKGSLVNSSSSGSKFRPKPIFIVFPLLILIGLIVLAYFVPQVTAIIKITPKPFDKEMEVIVTTSNTGTVSSSSAVVTGNFIDVSEVGTKKGVASGKKLVGDKARGSVTIYGVSSSKTFSAGTTLFSSDGLKLTLDHDVSVASGDAITPATVTTTVTAASIGDSYNFPSGTKFTIAGFSSSQYLAKNDSSLTGGNSHQAKVVTKEDQDRLMATLSAELTQKAESDLQSQVTPGQNLLPNAMVATVTSKKFSKEIDTEADTASLDLTADYRGVIFSRADLVAVFVQKFSSDIPAGFIFPPDQTNVEVKNTKNDKAGNSILLIHLTGGLIPAVDKSAVIGQISGKNLSNAISIINSLPSVSGVTIDTQPRFLGFISSFFLPWKKDHIRIDVVSD